MCTAYHGTVASHSQGDTGMQTKNKIDPLASRNLRLAKAKWGILESWQRQTLAHLSEEYELAIAFGDLLLLDTQWYVTHSGLLRLATRKACAAIRTDPVPEFCDAHVARWVF